MKKILSVMLIISTLFTGATALSAGVDEVQFIPNMNSSLVKIEGDFIYDCKSNTIIEYIGRDGVCEIPDNCRVGYLKTRYVLNPVPITKLIINGGADIENLVGSFENLREVEIREGITEIPYGFLSDCHTLEKISLPSTVTKIDDHAFENCTSLKEIILPEKLTSIGYNAFFKATSLSGDLIMPDSVTHLGEQAFYGHGKLNKVHLSNNLEVGCLSFFSDAEEINIPDSLLKNPPRLKANEITFNSDMTVEIYKAIRHSNWCKNKYWAHKTDKTTGTDKDFIIVDNTLLRYVGSDKAPVIPEGVTTIMDSAFSFTDIDTVILPKSLLKIESSAFSVSKIKSITIPENVKEIQTCAFHDCAWLEKVVFEGVTGFSSPGGGQVLPFEGCISLKRNGIEFKKEMLLPDYFYSFIQNGSKKELIKGVESMFDSGFKALSISNQDINAAEKPKATPKPIEADKPTERPVKTTTPMENAAPTPASTVNPTTTPSPQTLTVSGGEELTITVGGREVEFPDAKPFIDGNDRTQIPIRAVAEMLDCAVDWNDAAKTAIINKADGAKITVTINSDVMNVDGKETKMDTTAIIKDERTYIPVRFVAEAMGLTVKWK